MRDIYAEHDNFQRDFCKQIAAERADALCEAWEPKRATRVCLEALEEKEPAPGWCGRQPEAGGFYRRLCHGGAIPPYHHHPHFTTERQSDVVRSSYFFL